MDFRAQGTIEYLVIIGIVVVVSLSVVTLSTNIISAPAQNASYFGIQIENATGILGMNELVIASGDTAFLTIKNNSGESVTIKSISVGGVGNTFNAEFAFGSKKPFSLDTYGGNCTCQGGTLTKTCEVIVLYELSSGLTRAVRDNVLGECNVDASLVGIEGAFSAIIDAPVLTEVTMVDESTLNRNPSYTFRSSKSGTISYFGSCASSTTSVNADENTIITLTSAEGGELEDGTYSDCNITVTPRKGPSGSLIISEFSVTVTAPQLSFTYPQSTDYTSLNWGSDDLIIDWDTSTTCLYSTDGETYGYEYSQCGGLQNYSISENFFLTGDPSEGSHTWYIRGRDSSQNSGNSQITFSYAIDEVSAPTIVSPEEGGTYYNDTWAPVVSWAVSSIDGTCYYNYDGADWSPVSCDSAGSDISSPGWGGGHTLNVKNCNVYDTCATDSKNFTWSDYYTYNYGCTDEDATNYDSRAIFDNDSCTYGYTVGNLGVSVDSPVSEEYGYGYSFNGLYYSISNDCGISYATVCTGNGCNVDYQCSGQNSCSWAYYGYNFPFATSGGSYSWSVTAFDYCNHSNSATSNFGIANPPSSSINFNSLSDQASYTSSDWPGADYSVSNADSCQYSTDGGSNWSGMDCSGTDPFGTPSERDQTWCVGVYGGHNVYAQSCVTFNYSSAYCSAYSGGGNEATCSGTSGCSNIFSSTYFTVTSFSYDTGAEGSYDYTTDCTSYNGNATPCFYKYDGSAYYYTFGYNAGQGNAWSFWYNSYGFYGHYSDTLGGTYADDSSNGTPTISTDYAPTCSET